VATLDTGIKLLGRPAPAMRDEGTTLRALGPADEIAFRNLLLGLDEASRISRFSFHVGDDAIVRHARHAMREAVFIAGVLEDGELCGAVELYESGEPDEVEAAFAVARRWRRQGIGTALLYAALEWAKRSNCTKLQMAFTRGNWPMRRLAGKAEPSLHLGLEKMTASVATASASSGLKLARAKWSMARRL